MYSNVQLFQARQRRVWSAQAMPSPSPRFSKASGWEVPNGFAASNSCRCATDCIWPFGASLTSKICSSEFKSQYINFEGKAGNQVPRARLNSRSSSRDPKGIHRGGLKRVLPMRGSGLQKNPLGITPFFSTSTSHEATNPAEVQSLSWRPLFEGVFSQSNGQHVEKPRPEAFLFCVVEAQIWTWVIPNTMGGLDMGFGWFWIRKSWKHLHQDWWLKQKMIYAY